MFPYHFQIDSLYFHVMKGSLLKGKQISSLLLRLQKHKKYDLKQNNSSNMMGQLDLVLATFLFISKWGWNIDLHWYTFSWNLLSQIHFLKI